MYHVPASHSPTGSAEPFPITVVANRTRVAISALLTTGLVPVGPLRAWVLVVITRSVQAVVTDWTVVGFVRGDVLRTEVAGRTYGAVGLTGDVVIASRWTGQGCGGSLGTIVADRIRSSNGRIRTLKRDVLIQVLGLACYILQCNQVQSLCCWWLIWPIQNDAKKLKNDCHHGT